VERDTPPRTLVVHSAPTVAPQRSFLLCPYPTAAKFAGGLSNPMGLNVNDAANWSCRTSESEGE
jgi:hypothetical protein